MLHAMFLFVVEKRLVKGLKIQVIPTMWERGSERGKKKRQTRLIMSKYLKR